MTPCRKLLVPLLLAGPLGMLCASCEPGPSYAAVREFGELERRAPLADALHRDPLRGFRRGSRAAPLRAQTAADSAAIRRAALDYIEGWYTGDAARMARAVHPELAKRIVLTDSASGRSVVRQMGSAELVRGTRAGGGRATPPHARLKAVTILDIFENAASVRVAATQWIDYLHVAKVDGSWRIINVLWELRPTGR